MSTILSRASGMVALSMAAALGGPFVGPNIRADQNNEQPLRNILIPDYVGGHGFNYRLGPGWTAAQVKHMARKAKNRRRHKIACRRAK